jgi:hypothetical protein
MFQDFGVPAPKEAAIRIEIIIVNALSIKVVSNTPESALMLENSEMKIGVKRKTLPCIKPGRVKAVRAGFEPAVQFNPYGSLANY